jgi:(2R)-sulfolactate sulfo-lyase subunit alpha
MKPHFLFHNANDSVGVAVVDIKAGEKLTGACLENGSKLSVDAVDDVPLGHKVSLKDLKDKEEVIKYGISIGHMVQSAAKGKHIHVHNLKTNRW